MMSADHISLGIPRVAYRNFIVHMAASVAIFVLPQPGILIPVIVFLLFMFYKNNQVTGVLVLGVYALCSKSESVYYAYSIVFFILFLLDKRKVAYDADKLRVVKRFRQFFIYALLLYVLQFFMEGSPLSFPFFTLTFFSPVLIMFYVWYADVRKGEFLLFLQHLVLIAIAQAFVAIVFQAIPAGISAVLAHPTMGDVIMGNTNSPNSLAFLLFTAILPFLLGIFLNRSSLTSRTKLLVSVIFALFTWVSFLNDAKTLYFSFIIAAAGILLSKNIFFEKMTGRKVMLISLSVIALIFVSSVIVSKFEKVMVDYEEYITGKYNAKWQYYTSAFSTETRPFHQYLLGTGPGTNGSRAANALAYDVLYKKENTVTLPKFIPAASNEFTRRYLSKYFTEEYAEASGERSAVLGNPFNSVCAVFVEFGIIGTFLFFRFFYTIFMLLVKRKDYLAMSVLIILIADVVNAFLDQSFEKPLQMHLTYLFVGFAFMKHRATEAEAEEELEIP